MRVGSLFSGIGGIDLGLERAGFTIAWQCEIDPFCQRVLAKHWPDVPRSRDVRRIHALSCTPGSFCDDCLEPVDLLCGGFPCPVVSQAARGRNVAESLWPEFARIIRELRPRYILLENVEGLLSRNRGFDRVLGDLAESGFNATWRVLEAAAFEAPQHRARLWLVGYPDGVAEPGLTVDAEVARLPQFREAVRGWANPPLGLGVAHGVPARVDRLRSLGNAVVPQVAEYIGRRILEVDRG